MERIKSKLLRIMTATAIVGGGLGISSSTNHSSEVNATNNIANTRTNFAVRDLGTDGGVRISYLRTWTDQYDRYEPNLLIEFRDPMTGARYEIPFSSSCDVLPDEDGFNCNYSIPEARSWSEFRPLTSVVDRSVQWKELSDGTFVRDTGVQRTYLPIILK